ncbi:hypothetical protein cyc_06943 [Cyclospora cayetanensis]|uniref:Uncharacterized protein n=1 Tax=Cyclospora cayetanensis TaxID=88456 RepID=A0A1D3D017_9EIME|nr:hypothetical protein cyc_06943 [Cyclospora cayetanensis]
MAKEKERKGAGSRDRRLGADGGSCEPQQALNSEGAIFGERESFPCSLDSPPSSVADLSTSQSQLQLAANVSQTPADDSQSPQERLLPAAPHAMPPSTRASEATGRHRQPRCRRLRRLAHSSDEEEDVQQEQQQQLLDAQSEPEQPSLQHQQASNGFNATQRFRFTPNVSAASTTRALQTLPVTAPATSSSEARELSLAGMLLNAAPLQQQLKQSQQTSRPADLLRLKTEEHLRRKGEQQQQQSPQRLQGIKSKQQLLTDEEKRSKLLQQSEEGAATFQQQQHNHSHHQQQQQQKRGVTLASLSATQEDSFIYSPLSLPFHKEQSSPTTVAEVLRAAAAQGVAAACGSDAGLSGGPFLMLQLPRHLPPVDRVAMSGKVTLRLRTSNSSPAASSVASVPSSAPAAAQEAQRQRGYMEFAIALGCETRSVQQCGVLIQPGAEFVLLGDCQQRLVVCPQLDATLQASKRGD